MRRFYFPSLAGKRSPMERKSYNTRPQHTQLAAQQASFSPHKYINETDYNKVVTGLNGLTRQVAEALCMIRAVPES